MNKIIIIGGGISSLTFAYLMTKHKIKSNIHIIEKTDRLGGRILTEKIKDDYIDSGAFRFNDTHESLIKMIKELNLMDQIEELPNVKKYFLMDEFVKIPIKKFKNILEDAYHDKNSKNYSVEEYLSTRMTTKDYYKLKIFYNYEEIFPRKNMYDFARSIVNYNTKKYYHFSKGYETIILALYDILKKNSNIHFHFSEKIKSIMMNKNNKNNFIVSSSLGKKYYCNRLILAIPKKNLLQMEGLEDMLPLIQSVRSLTLNRIYAKFESIDWFGKNNFHTDLPIQQINIVNFEKKIIMISYSSDGTAFDFVNSEIHSSKDYNLLWYRIKKYLERILNSKVKREKKKIIPDPIWIKENYWATATYHWNPNYNSKDISNKLLKPYKDVDLHIIGSAYSRVQGWSEGAIESANNLYDLIFKKGNRGIDDNNENYYSEEEVSKHNSEDDAWIILFNNVYDVTRWIDLHPGGPIIKKFLGKDATKIFLGVKHSMNSYQILMKYKIGKLKKNECNNRL